MDDRLSRKDKVLTRLRDANGQWLSGPDLANPEVGGSEGLKRLRELRAEGHDIQKRRHPDRNRAVFQYRLIAHERPADYAAYEDSFPVAEASHRLDLAAEAARIFASPDPEPPLAAPPPVAAAAPRVRWACMKCGGEPAHEPQSLSLGSPFGRARCPNCDTKRKYAQSVFKRA